MQVDAGKAQVILDGEIPFDGPNPPRRGDVGPPNAPESFRRIIEEAARSGLFEFCTRSVSGRAARGAAGSSPGLRPRGT